MYMAVGSSDQSLPDHKPDAATATTARAEPSNAPAVTPQSAAMNNAPGQVATSGCSRLLKWLFKWLQVAAFAKFKIRIICTLAEITGISGTVK